MDDPRALPCGHSVVTVPPSSPQSRALGGHARPCGRRTGAAESQVPRVSVGSEKQAAGMGRQARGRRLWLWDGCRDHQSWKEVGSTLLLASPASS